MKKNYILPFVKTNNFVDLGEKIIAQWNKLLSLNLKHTVKYGIYCNYESNYKGNYDFSVGIEEEFSNSILKEIPNYKYRICYCEQSKILET